MIGNPIYLLAAALIPMFIGAIWYGPLFGKTWMKQNDFTEEYLEKNGNMALILGLSYVMSVILAAGLSGLTNHQSGLLQLLVTHPEFDVVGSEAYELYNSFMEKFGDRHRTFGHGAFHGALAAILLAMPLILINGLFERKSTKLMFIHIGYWTLTLALMGGVICQFL